jgi:hypothetical protein|tara:strand:- start:36 stop:3725 length:3690 start_codon:yes stop_codon:yes gene_type:complete
MAVISYDELIRDKGGGNIHFAWTVSSYPWICCSSTALATFLDSGTDNAKFVRRRLLGRARWNGGGANAYFADDTTLCPTIVNLEIPSAQTIATDPTKGLRGGGFRVELNDVHVGKAWGHVKSDVGGDPFWGVEGIHRVAQPRSDKSIAWGTIADGIPVKTGDTTITLNRYSGNSETLHDRITAVTGAYKLVWIGRECIALDKAGSVASGDNYVMDIHKPTGISGRGLFRSRAQSHWTSTYDIANPIVTDVPTSIIDKVGWVWGVPMNEDSSDALVSYTSLTSHDDEDIGPAIVRWGVVSSNVETKKGKTTIAVNPPWSQWNTDLPLQKFEGATLAKYHFNRADPTVVTSGHLQTELTAYTGANSWLYAAGTGSGGEIKHNLMGDMWRFGQSPHLVIREHDGASDMTGTIKCIWLCARGSTVTYDTMQDLVDALNTELERCHSDHADYESQTSGDGTATYNEWVNLTHHYRVKIDNTRASRYATDMFVVNRDDDVPTHSFVEGPLSWILMLGNPHVDDHDAILDGMSTNAPWYEFAANTLDGFTQRLYTGSSRGDVQNVGGSHWQLLNINNEGPSYTGTDEQVAQDLSDNKKIRDRHRPLHDHVSNQLWRSPYYYGWEWDILDVCWSIVNGANGTVSSSVANTDHKFDTWMWERSHQPPGSDKWTWQVPEDNSSQWRLYFTPDSSLGTFSANDVVSLGYASDKINRQLFGTVAAVGTSGIYPYMEFSPTTLKREANGDKYGPTMVGSNLIYHRGLEIKKGRQSESDPKSPTALAAWDPHELSEIVDMSGQSLGDLYRKLFGETVTGMSMPEQMRMTWALNFVDDLNTTRKDFRAFIDWDQLDDLIDASLLSSVDSVFYKLPLDQDNFNPGRAFQQCLLFAGLSAVWEFDQHSYQYMMRFRLLTPPVISQAWVEGRTLGESQILADTTTVDNHNDTWIFNKLKAQYNKVEGDFNGTVNIDYDSGHAGAKRKSRSLGVKDELVHVSGDSNAQVQKDLASHFAQVLYHLAEPQVTHRTRATISTSVSLAVGRECLVTDSASHKPFTHELGLTDQPALVTSVTTDFRSGRNSLRYMITDSKTYGWGPAAWIPANSSTVGASYVDVTPTNLKFHSWRPESTFFDCYNYSKSTRRFEARSCSCSDYAVWAIPAEESPTILKNFTVSEVQTGIDAATYTFRLDGSDYTNWTTTKAYLIVFADWDTVESCQQLYTYFADPDDRNGGLGAAGDAPHRWV